MGVKKLQGLNWKEVEIMEIFTCNWSNLVGLGLQEATV
jgi:hypothetical protein